MVAELLLRPDLGKRAYRLKCRFVTGSFPSERTLEKAKYEAADLFVSDMAKRGWQYMAEHGFKMRGPFPATEIISLPKPSDARWHIPSRELLPAVSQGYNGRAAIDGGYARNVPLITETDSWEFELAGVFIHDTIMTEVPDPHEEKTR